MAGNELVAPRLLDPSRWTGKVIDADVHAAVGSIEVLLPYLDDIWHQHIEERGWPGPKEHLFRPPNLPTTARNEWRPADRRRPGSEVELLRADILDAWDVEYAVLNCDYPIDVGHPDLAAALASAVNDWLIAEWLDRDDRLRASLLLPGADPAAMAREVHRVGAHPGFVQVNLPIRSGRLYGRRFYHPLYEAIEEYSLVIGLQMGGHNEGMAPTPNGWPSWYVEEYTGEIQVFESQLLSLLAEGVFQKFPGLRFTMMECGFSWLPTWGWRMNKEWKGMHREIPWLDRPPMDLVREHFRFTTAPFDIPEASEVEVILEWLDSDKMLMFATDYPHGHADSLSVLLGGAASELHGRIMSENAREWYGL